MKDNRSVPMYQQKRKQVAGVEATLKGGDKADAPSATWLVSEASLGGLVPRVGDRCRGTDGVWRTVSEVGALTNGSYPLLCEREEGSDQ